MSKPCELLDMIEKVAKDNLPLYEELVVDAAQIHLNPNRNHNPNPNSKSNETMQLYDLFEIFGNFAEIYHKSIKGRVKFNFSTHLT